MAIRTHIHLKFLHRFCQNLDTYTIRQDRTIAFDPAVLVFAFNDTTSPMVTPSVFLRGLQYIYTNEAARKKVFSTLEATLDLSVNKVAVPLIEEAKQRYPLINQCSFDKGYYS